MRTTLPEVHEFLSQKTLAIAGVSRSGKKFGNAIAKELKQKGYKIYILHPSAESIEGERCYRKLRELPEQVGGLVLCVPPVQSEIIVREALGEGIKRIWFQQGSESYSALRTCEQNGITAVHGQCLLMFAEPVQSFHGFHRWIWRLIGKYPSVSSPVGTE